MLKKGSIWMFILVAALLMVRGAFAANDLIGIDPVEPVFSIDAVGTSGVPTVNYEGGTLTINSTPKTFVERAGDPAQLVVNGTLTLTAKIDSNGLFTPAGSTFTLTGTVGANSGTLLSGDIVGYGIVDLGSTTTAVDFKLTATGGAMVALFPDGYVGITVSLTSSNYTGSFASNWSAASNSGEIGYFPEIPPGTDCVGVYPLLWYLWNPDKWPADQLVLGNKTYNKKQLKSIMYGPFCDKTFIVAKEQIVTKFNLILNEGSGREACRVCIQDTVQAVDEWLIANPLGSRKKDWDDIKVQWKNEKQYNTGLFCAPSYLE